MFILGGLLILAIRCMVREKNIGKLYFKDCFDKGVADAGRLIFSTLISKHQ